MSRPRGSPRTPAAPICGSSCCPCCRVQPRVLSTSSGWTGRGACSSWWTARRCPDCGVSTRTSLTWTMRPWGELWDTIIREEYWPRWMVRDWSISSWMFQKSVILSRWTAVVSEVWIWTHSSHNLVMKSCFYVVKYFYNFTLFTCLYKDGVVV